MQDIEEILNEVENSNLKEKTKKELKKILFGLIGEKRIREVLKLNKIKFFQVDLLFSYHNKWYLCEVKHQDIFKPPPFYGHGLPPWQIKDRLEFQNIFNAKVIFFVLDKETKTIYYQYLENLNSKKSNPSSTGNRIIYPVENFLILKRPEELMKFLT